MKKIKFWEAWKLWRSGGKTMIGEPVTFGAVVILAVSGLVEGTFSFLVEKFWGWIWGRQKKKEK